MLETDSPRPPDTAVLSQVREMHTSLVGPTGSSHLWWDEAQFPWLA